MNKTIYYFARVCILINGCPICMLKLLDYLIEYAHECTSVEELANEIKDVKLLLKVCAVLTFQTLSQEIELPAIPSP